MVGLTIPQVQVRLCSILPRRAFDASPGVEIVTYGQQRNHATSISHGKRRIARLHQLGNTSL